MAGRRPLWEREAAKARVRFTDAEVEELDEHWQEVMDAVAEKER